MTTLYDGSEFRARAQIDWQMDGVSVSLLQGTGNSAWLYSFDTDRVYSDAEATVPPVEAHPLRLAEGAARALYEALGEYFGGRPVTITDREDLKVERVRVDKLQEAMVAIALSKTVTVERCSACTGRIQ